MRNADDDPAAYNAGMPDLLEQAAQQTVISVAELNRLARAAVERGVPLVWVAGEISNFKRYDSGHCYFTLKDENAAIDANDRLWRRQSS